MDASAKQPEYTNVERPEDVENVMKIKKKKKEDIFKGLVKKWILTEGTVKTFPSTGVLWKQRVHMCGSVLALFFCTDRSVLFDGDMDSTA